MGAQERVEPAPSDSGLLSLYVARLLTHNFVLNVNLSSMNKERETSQCSYFVQYVRCPT